MNTDVLLTHLTHVLLACACVGLGIAQLRLLRTLRRVQQQLRTVAADLLVVRNKLGLARVARDVGSAWGHGP